MTPRRPASDSLLINLARPIGSVGTRRIESEMVAQLLKNGSIGNGPDLS
jgi:hypothetical protein